MELKLKNKSDETLLDDLKSLVSKERELVTEILHYLKEVEDRRLYLERGFSSLYDFATKELGYSEGAAHRRIAAMRLIKEIPQVEEKLEKGKISLMVASQIQSFVRRENKKRKEEKKSPISKSEKLELIEVLEGTSARICEKKLLERAPEIALPKEKVRSISEEKTLVQFVADKKLMNKIERLKWLLSHQNVEGRYDQLFEKVIDMALEKLDPEKRRERRAKKAKKGALGESSPPALEVETRNRHIPQAIRDQVWTRDRGRCQYQAPVTGKKCESQYCLEIDHRKAYALGGGHQIENLQLLCRNHKQHKARKIFGEVGLN